MPCISGGTRRRLGAALAPVGERAGGPDQWCDHYPTWQGVVVTDPEEPAHWLSLADVAGRLEVPVNKVQQMVRDRALLAVRRDGSLQVPAELVANRTVLKHLPGVLTLLHDAGYTDEEALRWLYRPDDSLPGTAAQALGGDRATEVKRRAQAVGF
jgi:hypothetical protein